MIYFSFIGNNDQISPENPQGGACLSTFRYYVEDITEIYLFITPNKDIDYLKVGKATVRMMKDLKTEVSVNLISIENLSNPVDYDLVYPVILDNCKKIVDTISQGEYLINISSGTPTMATCWILLVQSGLIPNAKPVQALPPQFWQNQLVDGKKVNLPPVREVHFEIDDFPNISTPSAQKRQLTIINREKEQVTNENRELATKIHASEIDNLLPFIIGKSKQIREIKEQILDEIDNNTSVLILGERGTGKELIKQAIWDQFHKQNSKPLIERDCGSYSEQLFASELFGYKKGAFTGANADKIGCIEDAKNGMLFLDEIGNLSLENQRKLLRFIQFKKYIPMGGTENDKKETKVQVVAATNKNVNDYSLFAQDIKDRFEIKINLPALKERKEDIRLLIDFFITIYAKQYDLSHPTIIGKDVIDRIIEYDWPGNIRELELWLKKIVRKYREKSITLNDLPDRIIEEIIQEGDTDTSSLPALPLPCSLPEYVELIRIKARSLSNGNNAEVDRLLCQTDGTEKQRQYRIRQNN